MEVPWPCPHDASELVTCTKDIAQWWRQGPDLMKQASYFDLGSFVPFSTVENLAVSLIPNEMRLITLQNFHGRALPALHLHYRSQSCNPDTTSPF